MKISIPSLIGLAITIAVFEDVSNLYSGFTNGYGSSSVATNSGSRVLPGAYCSDLADTANPTPTPQDVSKVAVNQGTEDQSDTAKSRPKRAWGGGGRRRDNRRRDNRRRDNRRRDNRRRDNRRRDNRRRDNRRRDNRRRDNRRRSRG